MSNSENDCTDCPGVTNGGVNTCTDRAFAYGIGIGMVHGIMIGALLVGMLP